MDGDEGCVEVGYWVVCWWNQGGEIDFEGADVGGWDEGCVCEGFRDDVACFCDIYALAVSTYHTANTTKKGGRSLP